INLTENYLIHPDQFTNPEKVLKRIEANKTIGPWNDPYSAGCQVVRIEDFDKMTNTLEGLGFEYNGKDKIDVTIKEEC
ncbi:MAG: hypothetical protein JXR64_12345, partial [Spirochaetales bacterium]|nr:hypothetical protein [Spirochaetales bacterium]